MSAGARVIAVDRPGYGESSLHPGRTYSDWAEDVTELTSHLKFPSFAVVGFSSGGPHALVCAAKNIPGLAACSLVSSDAPYYKMGKDLMEKMFGAEVTPEWALRRAEANAKEMAEGYQKMSKKDRIEIAMADIEEATKQGFEGPASDTILEASPSWGFELGQYGIPMKLWHGTEDHDVPVAAGRYMAEHLLGTSEGNAFNCIEGESHTLIRRHWETILKETITASKGGNL